MFEQYKQNIGHKSQKQSLIQFQSVIDPDKDQTLRNY